MSKIDLNEIEGVMRYLQLQEKFSTPEELSAYFKKDARFEGYDYEADEDELMIAAQLAIDEINSWNF